MNKLFRIYFCLCFAFSSTIFSQSDKDEILAKVGNRTITVGEFKERYELTPQINRNLKGKEDYLKFEVLYSIIAEKLWALEAEKLGFDTSNTMLYTFKTLEKMYWRDALYTEEVKKKSLIDDADYAEALDRSSDILKTNYIYSEKENEIDSLYSLLINGMSFDSLLTLRPEFYEQISPYIVTYGNMEKYVEDSLYHLIEGKYTSPIKSPEGWYIFRLSSKEKNLITNEQDESNLEKNIRNTLENRAYAKSYQNFYKTFFKDLTVHVDGEIFWSFSNHVINALKNRSEKIGSKPGESIHLEISDFRKIEKSIDPDTLRMTFIKFDNNPVTLKQFIYEFMFKGFYSDRRDPDLIRAKLNSRVKGFIEKELLSREAYKRGYNHFSEVEHFTEMWKNNYLGTLFKRDLMKNVDVSEQEVLDYYNREIENITFPIMVNIVEILTDSLEVIEAVLKEIENGTDLKVLAKKHTKRKWTKDKGGEFGLFPTTLYGDIGRIAGDLEIGEIFGPLETEDGYSIFQLIDKKIEYNKLPGKYDDIKDELERHIKGQKLMDLMVNETAGLANSYGVNVNKNLLKAIKVANLSMIVYRYMGFGGRILAIPLTTPFINWVEEWKNSKESLP
ncbi:peptidyl-prolyl cis-trans isomerase [Bacteroidota bacterium]